MKHQQSKIILHRDSVRRLTLLAFVLGMVSGAGVCHTIRVLVAGGVL